ncbi:MAG: methyltransferase domain-containing protein [Cyanobacteria bacterium J06632_22]
MTQQFLHTTPSELIQDVVSRQVEIKSSARRVHRTFTLSMPMAIDPLLDHPSTAAAFEADEYLPYWADLWPASQMLGEAILSALSLPQRVLEIGCGLGLSGLAALSQGCHVTFSDYDDSALAFAARNAQQNGFTHFETQQMDWRHPPDGMQFPLILAADVMYEARHTTPVAQLIAHCLTDNGECWLVDPNRPYAAEFRAALSSAHLIFEVTETSTMTVDHRTAHGTLYKISRSSSIKSPTPDNK